MNPSLDLFDCSRLRIYRDEIESLQIQAGPGRTVKQEQEEISHNHVRRLNLISVKIKEDFPDKEYENAMHRPAYHANLVLS